MNGKEMCSLRKDDFCSRAPVFVGDILWEHLQLLQSECDREQAALKNAPPKLSEISQNPAAISPIPPPPRPQPAQFLTHSPPAARRSYMTQQPPSSSPHHHSSAYTSAAAVPTSLSSHSPPHVYSDCSNSSPQRAPVSPPRVYTTLESSVAAAAAPRLFSPVDSGYRPAPSPQYPGQSPRPVSPPSSLHQQDIKSEYPAYAGYPPLYPGGGQYPRSAAYPQQHHHQFAGGYGQGYPAPYAPFSADSSHYQLSARWGSADTHPAVSAYQVQDGIQYDMITSRRK